MVYARLLAPIGWVVLSSTALASEGDPAMRLDGESRLSNVRTLTPASLTSAPRWSTDGGSIVFTHAGKLGALPGGACEQAYRISSDGSGLEMLSTGKGRARAAGFLPSGRMMMELGSCEEGTSAVHSTKKSGSDPLLVEPGQPKAINTDAVVCSDGSLVLSSDREGDRELYVGSVDSDGVLKAPLKRLTRAPGYDGRPVFAPDCGRIAWSAGRDREHPEQTEIWVADADGAHARQLTDLAATSTAPTFAPDGASLVFASNPRDAKRSDLYRIRLDGTRLERVTHSGGTDGEPRFSPDGRSLAFTSIRGGAHAILIADWVPEPPEAAAIPPADGAVAADRVAAWATGSREFELEGLGLRRMTAGVWGWGSSCGRVRPVMVVAPSGAPMDLAVLRETARATATSETPGADRGCVVFGALGAEALSKLRPAPKAVIALDHVGALEEGRVAIQGAGSAPQWAAVIRKQCEEHTVFCEELGSKTEAPLERVPWIELGTTGAAGAYNYTGASQVAQLTADLALAVRAKTLSYRKIKVVAPPLLAKPEPVATPAPVVVAKPEPVATPGVTKPEPALTPAATPEPLLRRKRSYLGAIPDYADFDNAGLRILGTRAGSPAREAGLKEHDLLTGIEIKSSLRKLRALEDYMGALAELKPGEQIVLHVRRGTQEIHLPAQVGARD